MWRLGLLCLVLVVLTAGCARQVGFVADFKPLTGKVAGPCQIGQDQNGDGVIDSRIDFSYAKDGKLELQESDRGNDGSIDNKIVYAYADGRLQKVTTDRENDGISDKTELYSYDKAGNARVTINGQQEIQIEYDKQGRMLKERFDRNHDGNCDRVVSYVYNEAGLMIEQNRDSDCDGQADRRISYIPGSDGRIAEETMIDISTKQVFAVISYRYRNTTLVKQKMDQGQVYEIVELEYDPFGNLLSESYFDVQRRLRRQEIYSYGCWN